MTDRTLGIKVFIILSLLILYKPAKAQYTVSSVYPHWFLFPSKNSDIIAGFGSRDVNAKYHAALRHDIFASCLVSGYVEEYSETSIDLEIRKNYYYFYDEQRVDSINQLLSRFDVFYTHVMNGESIQAFTFPGVDPGHIGAVDLDKLGKPSWLKQKIWMEDGYINSIGKVDANLGTENATWMKSEEDAIFNALVFHTQKLISSTIYYEKNGDRKLQNYLATIIDFKLQGIEIMQRYPDVKNAIYYTRIRIKATDISNELTTSEHR